MNCLPPFSLYTECLICIKHVLSLNKTLNVFENIDFT